MNLVKILNGSYIILISAIVLNLGCNNMSMHQKLLSQEKKVWLPASKDFLLSNYGNTEVLNEIPLDKRIEADIELIMEGSEDVNKLSKARNDLIIVKNTIIGPLKRKISKLTSLPINEQIRNKQSIFTLLGVLKYYYEEDIYPDNSFYQNILSVMLGNTTPEIAVVIADWLSKTRYHMNSTIAYLLLANNLLKDKRIHYYYVAEIAALVDEKQKDLEYVPSREQAIARLRKSIIYYFENISNYEEQVLPNTYNKDQVLTILIDKVKEDSALWAQYKKLFEDY